MKRPIARERAGVTDGTTRRNSEYRALADFRRALRRFLHATEARARSAGITPQQHILLLIVRGHHSYPHVSIGEIARELLIRHHAASLLVDRSVRRGLLLRHNDPADRRRALISLSEEGERLLDDITDANRQELSALSEGLFGETLRRAISPETARNDARRPGHRGPGAD